MRIVRNTHIDRSYTYPGFDSPYLSTLFGTVISWALHVPKPKIGFARGGTERAGLSGVNMTMSYLSLARFLLIAISMPLHTVTLEGLRTIVLWAIMSISVPGEHRPYCKQGYLAFTLLTR